MTKLIACGNISTGAVLGTADKWYKCTDVQILNNAGNTDIRVDKLMLQCSTLSAMTAYGRSCVLVHITDENGTSLTASITSGTTDDAAMVTLLNAWKDNVFMTDFRAMGTGSAAPISGVIPLEANTRRLLKPGQKLYLTFLVQPAGAETTKSATCYYDSICWYSAAAQ